MHPIVMLSFSNRKKMASSGAIVSPSVSASAAAAAVAASNTAKAMTADYVADLTSMSTDASTTIASNANIETNQPKQIRRSRSKSPKPAEAAKTKKDRSKSRSRSRSRSSNTEALAAKATTSVTPPTPAASKKSQDAKTFQEILDIEMKKLNVGDHADDYASVIASGPVHLEATLAYVRKAGLVGRYSLDSEWLMTLSDYDKLELAAKMHIKAIERAAEMNVQDNQWPLIANLGFDPKTNKPYVFEPSAKSSHGSVAEIVWGSLSNKMIKAVKGRDLKQKHIVTRWVLAKSKRDMYDILIAWHFDLLNHDNTHDPITFFKKE